MSAKIQHFLANIVPLLKAIVWELCYIFTTSVSVFEREKVTINKNVGFTDYPYRIRLLDYSKLAINRKNDISQFSDITPSSVFFWCCFVSLVKVSYWSKFHANIITASRLMKIFFCKGLTRNLEIGNTPVWVLPNIWRLGQVKHTKFGMNVSNEMLLIAAKCQGYSFYHFWVIKRKPTGGTITLSPRLTSNK